MNAFRTDAAFESPVNSGMAKYFASISASFHQDVEIETAPLSRLSSAHRLLSTVTLIPVLPFLAWQAVALVHPGELTIKGIPIAIHSFLLWWFLLTVAFIGVPLIFRRGSSQDALKRHSRRLRPPQLRFAYAYALMQELERYRISKLDDNYGKVRAYWQSFIPLLQAFFSPGRPYFRFTDGVWRTGGTFDDEEEGEILLRNPYVAVGFTPGRPSQSFFPQVVALSSAYSWFALTEETRKLVNAFDSFPRLVGDRITDRKDVKILEELFAALSSYFYTVIPDVENSTDVTPEAIQQTGRDALHRFTQILSQVPPYKSERPVVAPPDSIRKKIALGVLQVSGMFVHPNILVRFLAWFVLGIVLVVSAMQILLHSYPMKIDSTLIGICITAPLGLAAAAIAIVRRG